jgi:Fe-S cluster assembly ATP-binding protein
MAVKLEIVDLRAGLGGKEILKGVTLTVRNGEIHVLMGPNGSGKSTLSNVLMGHPKYEVYGGDVLLDGESILSLKPNKRAKLGMFLGFQYPLEIPGVKFGSFLHTAYKQLYGSDSIELADFFRLVGERMKVVGMDESFGGRYLNEGFSGGEKKRAEILQLLVLQPRLVILDETDSGLDIDALRTVANAINTYAGPDVGVLLITHYQRILKYVQPDYVHVLVDGTIATSGGRELAVKLEDLGYGWLKGEEEPVTPEAK